MKPLLCRYSLLVCLFTITSFETGFTQSSEIRLENRILDSKTNVISPSLTYRGTSTIPGLPTDFGEYYETHGIRFENGTHLSITPEGLEHPIFFIWDGNFQDEVLWTVYRGLENEPVFRKSTLQNNSFNNREAVKGIAEIELKVNFFGDQNYFYRTVLL